VLGVLFLAWSFAACLFSAQCDTNAEVGAYLSGELEIDFRLIRSETLDETLTSGTEKEKDAHDDL